MSTESSSDSVYTLFSPSVPCAEQIRRLQRFIDDIDTFREEIGSLPHSSTDQRSRQGKND